MNNIFNSVLTIIGFVLGFGLLIFLHEFGHYIVSKLFNIEVEEFGFGFPPRLVKLFQFRETEFTLNWIPFGAFVRPKGENDPNVRGGLAAANPWARLAVLLGGSTMNILTGILIFSFVFAQLGAPDYHKVLVAEIAPGSPAEQAGIRADDYITSINNEPVDSTEKLSAIVRQNLDREITITLTRGSEVIETRATPRSNPPEGQGALGIAMTNPILKTNMIGALPSAMDAAWRQVKEVITLPGKLISGQVSPDQGRVVGPVGIYTIYSEVRARDAQQNGEPIFGINTLYFMGIISIALGFTNLLPIPALDGGRILFVLPEILLRRRVPAQYENAIHLIGFTLLIILMIYITTQDIINPIAVP